MTAISPTVTAPRPTSADRTRRSAKTTAEASSLQTVHVERELGPNFVHIYASSILAVSLLFLVGVGLPTSMYLDDYMGGFGLGAFCAFWGGPSFGVMAGAARVSAWFEAHEDDH